LPADGDTPGGQASSEAGPADPREGIIDYLPAMRAFALSLTRNPASADDLVQDTIVKAWTHFDTFRPGTNLRSWLLAILRNTFISGLRKQRNEVRVEGVQPEAFSPPAHDGPLAMRDFLRAFHLLSDEHREVLTLVFVLGLSYAEAADALGVLPGTVKSRVSRARHRLMAILDLAENETIMPDAGPGAGSSSGRSTSG
jgi:RNA polymerase sigma-70 factor (ECF subfamily)